MGDSFANQAPAPPSNRVCDASSPRGESSSGGSVAPGTSRRSILAAAGRGSGRSRRGTSTHGENAAETALREVREETGVEGRLVEKLGDVRYTYTWDGERIFKIVSFFLVRYSSGRLGDIQPEMAVEVDDARWLPLAEAPKVLAYSGEKQMVERAAAALEP